VVLRHFYLMRGSLARVMPLFVWVAIDMVLWGFLTRYLNKVSQSGLDFVPALLGAVLFWDFFIRVMQGVTLAFFEDVWARNFLNVFATPMSIWEYVSGLVLSSIVTSTVGLIVMLVLSTLVFGLNFFTYGVLVVPFVAVLFLFGIAFGMMASSMVLRFGPAAEWYIWPIPAMVSPFVGVMYPLATLPEWMQWISRALPPSYVFESMRAILAGGSGSNLGVALMLAVGYVVGGCWLFARVYRRAVRTGLIARYSAETTT
jgi:ABC-2 type transport system permease protein